MAETFRAVHPSQYGAPRPDAGHAHGAAQPPGSVGGPSAGTGAGAGKAPRGSAGAAASRKAGATSLPALNLAQVAAQLVGGTPPGADAFSDADGTPVDSAPQRPSAAGAPRAEVFKFGDSMNAGMREDGRKLSLAMMAEHEASRATSALPSSALPSSAPGLVHGAAPAASGSILLPGARHRTSPARPKPLQIRKSAELRSPPAGVDVVSPVQVESTFAQYMKQTAGSSGSFASTPGNSSGRGGGAQVPGRKAHPLTPAPWGASIKKTPATTTVFAESLEEAPPQPRLAAGGSRAGPAQAQVGTPAAAATATKTHPLTPAPWGASVKKTPATVPATAPETLHESTSTPQPAQAPRAGGSRGFAGGKEHPLTPAPWAGVKRGAAAGNASLMSMTTQLSTPQSGSFSTPQSQSSANDAAKLASAKEHPLTPAPWAVGKRAPATGNASMQTPEPAPAQPGKASGSSALSNLSRTKDHPLTPAPWTSAQRAPATAGPAMSSLRGLQEHAEEPETPPAGPAAGAKTAYSLAPGTGLPSSSPPSSSPVRALCVCARAHASCACPPEPDPLAMCVVIWFIGGHRGESFAPAPCDGPQQTNAPNTVPPAPSLLPFLLPSSLSYTPTLPIATPSQSPLAQA